MVSLFALLTRFFVVFAGACPCLLQKECCSAVCECFQGGNKCSRTDRLQKELVSLPLKETEKDGVLQVIATFNKASEQSIFEIPYKLHQETKVEEFLRTIFDELTSEKIKDLCKLSCRLKGMVFLVSFCLLLSLKEATRFRSGSRAYKARFSSTHADCSTRRRKTLKISKRSPVSVTSM